MPEMQYVDPVSYMTPMEPQAPGAEPATTAPPDTPTATPATAEIPAPPTAPEVPAVTEDPADAALRSLIEGEKPLEWDDNSKSLFEKTFGEKDPLAFREQWKAKANELEIIRKDAEEGRALKTGLNKLNPAIARAIQLEQEGKDSVGYLRSLPDAVIQNKPAKELTDRQLIDTYKPDQVSEEEWTAIKTGNYEELGIDKNVLEYKVKTLRQLVEPEHEQKRSSIMADVSSAEQTRAQQIEAYNAATITAINHAKNDPIARLYVDQNTVEQFRAGELSKGLLTLDDGITPSPQMLTTLLKAARFDEYVKRAEAVGYARGKQDGMKEETSRMPAPNAGGRSVVAPTEQRELTPQEQFFNRIEAGLAKN